MSETDNPMQRIITRCWDDEAFKEKLLADPAATLRAEGVRVPEGMTVNVAVDTEDVRTLVIPLPPNVELSDDELTGIAAAAKSSAFICWQERDKWNIDCDYSRRDYDGWNIAAP